MQRETSLFLIGGFAGWILDTAYRTLISGTFQEGGFFSHLIGITIPFLPVYGFGLIIVYLLSKKKMPIIARFVILAGSLTLLELFAGIFTRVIIHQNLWTYPTGLFGMIDVLHTAYWGALGLCAHFILKRFSWLNTPDQSKAHL